MNPGVKYELLELERLLSDEQKLRTKVTGNVEESVKVEVERIKQTFIHEVFTFEDERHLERYIQYHQQALIRLMDKAAFLSGDGNDSRKKNFYQTFQRATEELLTFVERHFTKYFDQDAKAPLGYIDTARKEAQVNIGKVQAALKDKQADTRIIDIFFHALKWILVPNPDTYITYRRVMYAKEVQKELLRLLDTVQEQQNLNEELRQIMYYLNYNSVKVVTYHAHYITSLLEESETRAEKIEKLSFALKKINQAQVKPGIRYHQSSPPLKDQLNIYLSEEIAYQERLQHLNGGSPDRNSDSSMSGFKLKFDASVSQLAYLIRIFIESKIIMNSNLSQVLSFLVKYVITKRMETISYGSFRSKFYSVETGTKQTVRTMLHSLIQHIDKN